jgi:hypothetical protein
LPRKRLIESIAQPYGGKFPPGQDMLVLNKGKNTYNKTGKTTGSCPFRKGREA